jgi:sec-independent protein translocase protein TatA
MGISPAQLIIVLVIALILFGGAKKIPEIARSLGKAKGEFKKGMEEDAAEEAAKKESAKIESKEA